jgi:hypothetical protein
VFSYAVGGVPAGNIALLLPEFWMMPSVKKSLRTKTWGRGNKKVEEEHSVYSSTFVFTVWQLSGQKALALNS